MKRVLIGIKKSEIMQKLDIDPGFWPMREPVNDASAYEAWRVIMESLNR